MRHLIKFNSYLNESESFLYKEIMDLVERYYDDDYSNLEAHDRWLKSYTYDGMDKYPSDRVVADLLDYYPNDKESTIYRGLNFESKEEFDKFMNSIKSGEMETGSITSWSPSKSTAWQFAVTRPTYFLNFELMSADSERRKQREYMLGYRGVILKTTVKPGDAVDVTKSDYSKENEMILPPGTYEVEVEEIKPFKDLVKEQDPSEVVLGLTPEDIGKDTFNAQFFKYIIFHQFDISDKAKDHLYNLVKPRGEVIAQAEMKDPLWGDGKPRLHIAVGNKDFGPLYLYSYADVLGPKYLPKIKKVANEQMQALVDVIRESDLDFSGEAVGNLDYIMPYLRKYARPQLLREYQDLVRGELAREYKKLSSDDKVTDRVRDINKIKDPNQKRKAIDDYAKDLVTILKNMQAMA
jgi:hypothetical protein